MFAYAFPYTIHNKSYRHYDKAMDQELMQFFSSLDRSNFVDNPYKALADIDRPLPIGFGQTISQPSLVVYMTQQLQLAKNHRVLEIGTGSGYQTAFLAEFSMEVYTVECIENLANKAKERLKSMGYHNIWYKLGDGNLGWTEHAPYDRIMVCAAPETIPRQLIDQLDRNGIMILPVGKPDYQELVKITKNNEGKVEREKLLDVSFVKLVGNT